LGAQRPKTSIPVKAEANLEVKPEIRFSMISIKAVSVHRLQKNAADPANPGKYPVYSSFKVRLFFEPAARNGLSVLNANASPVQIQGTMKICCEAGSFTLLPGA
jgi:hypothetical protein